MRNPVVWAIGSMIASNLFLGIVVLASFYFSLPKEISLSLIAIAVVIFAAGIGKSILLFQEKAREVKEARIRFLNSLKR